MLKKPQRIILLGANGSGKSALGRALARLLNFAFFEVRDYWFYKINIPFTQIRPRKERCALLLADKYESGCFTVAFDRCRATSFTLAHVLACLLPMDVPQIAAARVFPLLTMDKNLVQTDAR